MAQLQLFAERGTPRLEEIDYLRRASMAGFAVQYERDWRRQQELISADIVSLFDADVVNAYELGEFDEPRLAYIVGDASIPPIARTLERQMLAASLMTPRSLLSTHPRLDRKLRPLAGLCSEFGITTEILLVRAYGETQAAFAVHWLGGERPTLHEQCSAFGIYWDNVGFAVHHARERQRVAQERMRLEQQLGEMRERAYFDRLTGLPNRFALDEELSRHESAEHLSILVLDFDGMREANAAYGYERGGDVLIGAVGEALRDLARDGEFPARLHTAGDEFALVLPGVDEDLARCRAGEIEAALDALEVPQTHRGLYHGASVGHATRGSREPTHQMRRRATEAMAARKHERRGPR